MAAGLLQGPLQAPAAAVNRLALGACAAEGSAAATRYAACCRAGS